MVKSTPCDLGKCPFMASEDQATPMYFCRDNCGLGVDEDEAEDCYEPDDSYDECGYDPYSGCYTDDC